MARSFRRAAVRSFVVGLPVAALSVSLAGAQAPPEEIVVTSSLVAQPRRQIGTAVSVLDAAELELRGYNDLVSALRTQPGIGVSNSGGPEPCTS